MTVRLQKYRRNRREIEVTHSRVFSVLGVAVFLTTLAELFYLVVWGMWLFPGGSLAGKIVWTLTCGIAMGAVIGAATLLWAEPLNGRRAAVWCAAAIVLVVGSYCAWLCSTIDAQFDYFGGPDNSSLFIVAGLVPALFGGILYAWLLYGRPVPSQHPVEQEK